MCSTPCRGKKVKATCTKMKRSCRKVGHLWSSVLAKSLLVGRPLRKTGSSCKHLRLPRCSAGVEDQCRPGLPGLRGWHQARPMCSENIRWTDKHFLESLGRRSFPRHPAQTTGESTKIPPPQGFLAGTGPRAEQGTKNRMPKMSKKTANYTKNRRLTQN